VKKQKGVSEMSLGTFLKVMDETHHAERQCLGRSALEEIRGPLFAQWIGSGNRVLDVGCRDGTLSKWFPKKETSSTVSTSMSLRYTFVSSRLAPW
jgi:2-polyprenyl-3-methyl-5-hydroxy-6-metoxy-1,4-benzoquinol methylase